MLFLVALKTSNIKRFSVLSKKQLKFWRKKEKERRNRSFSVCGFMNQLVQTSVIRLLIQITLYSSPSVISNGPEYAFTGWWSELPQDVYIRHGKLRSVPFQRIRHGTLNRNFSSGATEWWEKISPGAWKCHCVMYLYVSWEPPHIYNDAYIRRLGIKGYMWQWNV